MIINEIIINNLIRLNNLRKANKLNRESWQEFFLYKRIVKVNIDENELTEEVKTIINN